MFAVVLSDLGSGVAVGGCGVEEAQRTLNRFRVFFGLICICFIWAFGLIWVCAFTVYLVFWAFGCTGLWPYEVRALSLWVVLVQLSVGLGISLNKMLVLPIKK